MRKQQTTTTRGYSCKEEIDELIKRGYHIDMVIPTGYHMGTYRTGEMSDAVIVYSKEIAKSETNETKTENE